MTTTAPESHEDPRRIELTRAEQWVLHHVLVARCERARADRRTPPWWTVDAIEKLENGAPSFTPFEARRLRTDLNEYAEVPETPTEDAEAARTVAEKLERTFEADLAASPE
ncbi:hypothetical protein BRD00_01345 [Halobacteriales archaeon QS_8_69_26]|nr:MAG: hypothetical protein BRD00_01345 [Halobacteriales archaeon QS_8_69_26]